jgi:hypothetical protein
MNLPSFFETVINVGKDYLDALEKTTGKPTA